MLRSSTNCMKHSWATRSTYIHVSCQSKYRCIQRQTSIYSMQMNGHEWTKTTQTNQTTKKQYSFSTKEIIVLFWVLMSKSRKSHFNLDSKKQLILRSSCCAMYIVFSLYINHSLTPWLLLLWWWWLTYPSFFSAVRRTDHAWEWLLYCAACSLLSVIRVVFASLVPFSPSMCEVLVWWDDATKQKLACLSYQRSLRILAGWVNFCLLFGFFSSVVVVVTVHIPILEEYAAL